MRILVQDADVTRCNIEALKTGMCAGM